MTVGVFWFVAERDGGAMRWGAWFYTLVTSILAGLVGEAVIVGRRTPEATRAQIRKELRQLFTCGTPTIEAVFDVLGKDGDAGRFKREHGANNRFLRGMITEAEWGRTMRRYLRLD